jgi:hypothetical protein
MRLKGGACLAEEEIEAVVQAAEIEGVSEMGAGGAIGKELDNEPSKQREWHAKAWRPV